ncbi:outer membrane transport energization protein ExbB [Psychromonas ingrahamii 37]|uniref:Outer membrane transport energization protein ExbB n=1 Tax=Psychromonas ingrahamii (strain DSM 17664 / CCUG 51855 / 37) TaxID=357804 RepID=A1SZW6_PSYIN|nr:MotA/TolQ/ExbB proton channel family protein [Psychromonas ingrahamii]ABM05031.1 outer membrane transport energization protein ExbB [Psychromonas ingrahamii 37]
MAIDNITMITANFSVVVQQINEAMPLWFQQGGLIMWLLLLTSFLTTVVTLERCFVWLHYYFKKEHLPLLDCFAYLNKKEKTKALLACQRLDTPALNMLAFGINALPFSPNEKMESYAERKIHNMSRGQTLLDTVITLAPMLGILGTVLGIIHSFNILGVQGVNNPTEVVAGIAQALVSTAMGLSVALLALLPFNLFRALLQRLTLHLEGVGSEFYHICHQQRLISNELSEIMKTQELSRTNKDNEEVFKYTVQKDSEMPYHYEFKEGSDEVKVNLHEEMKELHKTSQESLAEMYTSPISKKKEYFSIDELKLQKQKETARQVQKESFRNKTR